LFPLSLVNKLTVYNIHLGILASALRHNLDQ